MTKKQAIEAMKEGKKVAHRHFDDHEWMKMDGEKFEFEDGVRCSQNLFWSDRQNDSWESDWRIVE
jgi:hypothetical protein